MNFYQQQNQEESSEAQARPGNGNAGLKLLVKGFTPMEHKLLQGVVHLSKRRQPRIDLLDEASAESVDVVMIDAQDPHAMAWAGNQKWLQYKPVIWVDSLAAHSGHTVAKRPIKWPILPVLLFQALEVSAKKQMYSPVSITNRRILVIDDSLPVRTHLKSLLEPQGFSVTEADSAEAGIQLATTAIYPCILMDVMMPGIDGYEACRRIKANHPKGRSPAIVMLTSKSSPFDRIRGKMAGCDDYLTKPVNAEHLRDVLSRYVGASSSADAQAFERLSSNPPDLAF
jgi:twitching motility two-component system response regulator PilG